MSDDGIVNGIVNISGKEYRTVALRLHKFREDKPDHSVETKILSNADNVLVRARIRDASGRIMAEGHAEETRGATTILKTSAVEVTETSAIGRALAVLGYLGTHIASEEEIELAQEQQDALGVVDELIKHNAAVRDHIESVTAIKAYLANDEYGAAYEAIAEIPDDDKLALWRSTTKGGIWTTKERAQMKSDDWTAARREYHGEDS